MEGKMETIYLSLGSNIGNRYKNLIAAQKSISSIIGEILNTSSLYETEPWQMKTDHAFLNMVVEVRTKLQPAEVLNKILKIEQRLGRKRQGISEYTDRTIDIDILMYGSLEVVQDKLQIPHPAIASRRFVLMPLCEIAKDKIHPTSKKSIMILLNQCSDNSTVMKWEP